MRQLEVGAVVFYFFELDGLGRRMILENYQQQFVLLLFAVWTRPPASKRSLGGIIGRCGLVEVLKKQVIDLMFKYQKYQALEVLYHSWELHRISCIQCR